MDQESLPRIPDQRVAEGVGGIADNSGPGRPGRHPPAVMTWAPETSVSEDLLFRATNSALRRLPF
jgi:hypothetical protein